MEEFRERNHRSGLLAFDLEFRLGDFRHPGGVRDEAAPKPRRRIETGEAGRKVGIQRIVAGQARAALFHPVRKCRHGFGGADKTEPHYFLRLRCARIHRAETEQAVADVRRSPAAAEFEQRLGKDAVDADHNITSADKSASSSVRSTSFATLIQSASRIEGVTLNRTGA